MRMKETLFMLPLQRIQITRIANQDCFRIKSKDKVIILDPGFLGPFDQQEFTLDSFEKADVMMISHHHYDHLQPELLDRLVSENTVILAPELCVGLTDKKIRVVHPGDEIKLDGLEIHVVDAYNTPQGKSNPKNHHQGEGVGYVFKLIEKTFYFAGDTDVIEAMVHLGPIDVAFLPISGICVMDVQEALEAAKIIKPNLVLMMHQMKVDPYLAKQLFAKLNIQSLVLMPNETLTL